MIQALFKLLILLVIGILIYNYFLGTPQEKKGVEKVVRDFKEFGISVAELLKSEKEKFDKGKYDKVLDKIENTLNDLKQSLQNQDGKHNREINDLLEEKEKISRELEKLADKNDGSDVDTTKLKEQLRSLLESTQKLISELDSGK